MIAADYLSETARMIREPRPSLECSCSPPRDVWFDRTICPEPCGSMHDRCGACGGYLGGCPVSEELRKPTPLMLAVADVLATASGALREYGPLDCDCEHGCNACDDLPWSGMCRSAVRLARAYRGDA